MTTGNEQWLREGLSVLSEQYQVVDLRDRALATSRQLGVRRAAVGAALVAVLLVGGAGAAVALGRPNAQAPRPPGASVTTPAPTPSPGATESGPEGPPVTIPPGAIDLTNASVDLPPFGDDSLDPCRGRQRFVRNIADPPADDIGFTASVVAEWAGDVNDDGAVDTVALISCEMSESYLWQVTAFDGTASAVRTIGRVVALNSQPDLRIVFAGQVLGDGSIRLEVGDFLETVVGHADEISTHQTRTYAWTGTGFAQTTGPTTFPPNPHLVDLRITTTGLALGKPVNGHRAGTFRVTVSNRAAVDAEHVTVEMLLPLWLEPTGSGWAGCDEWGPARGVPHRCELGRLAAGASRTLTLGMRAGPGSDSLEIGETSAAVYGDAIVFGTAVGIDAGPGDETVAVPITRI
jgi:hypothetical protein